MKISMYYLDMDFLFPGRKITVQSTFRYCEHMMFGVLGDVNRTAKLTCLPLQLVPAWN
jgi:hypothetical protein